MELLQWPGLGTTAFDTRRDHIRRRRWMAGETHTTDVRSTADRTQNRGDERRGHGEVYDDNTLTTGDDG